MDDAARGAKYGRGNESTFTAERVLFFCSLQYSELLKPLDLSLVYFYLDAPVKYLGLGTGKTWDIYEQHRGS